MLSQALAAGHGNREGAAIAHPFHPFQLKTAACQSRPERPANMRPAFGPIEARAAKEAALGTRGVQIDAETGEKIRTSGRYLARLFAEYHKLALAQALREADAEHTGEMIVAGPRAPYI